MMPSELSNMVTHTEIPQFDRVISASRQECIEGIVVSEGSLVEFYRVCMPLVAIVDGANGFVCICIVDNQLFVRTA